MLGNIWRAYGSQHSLSQCDSQSQQLLQSPVKTICLHQLLDLLRVRLIDSDIQLKHWWSMDIEWAGWKHSVNMLAAHVDKHSFLSQMWTSLVVCKGIVYSWQAKCWLTWMVLYLTGNSVHMARTGAANNKFKLGLKNRKSFNNAVLFQWVNSKTFIEQIHRQILHLINLQLVALVCSYREKL